MQAFPRASSPLCCCKVLMVRMWSGQETCMKQRLCCVKRIIDKGSCHSHSSTFVRHESRLVSSEHALVSSQHARTAMRPRYACIWHAWYGDERPRSIWHAWYGDERPRSHGSYQSTSLSSAICQLAALACEKSVNADYVRAEDPGQVRAEGGGAPNHGPPPWRACSEWAPIGAARRHRL